LNLAAWPSFGVGVCQLQVACVLRDPDGLRRVGREQAQPHEPLFAGLAKLAFGFQNFGFVGEAVEFLGVDQSVAVVTG